MDSLEYKSPNMEGGQVLECLLCSHKLPVVRQLTSSDLPLEVGQDVFYSLIPAARGEPAHSVCRGGGVGR